MALSRIVFEIKQDIGRKSPGFDVPVREISVGILP